MTPRAAAKAYAQATTGLELTWFVRLWSAWLALRLTVFAYGALIGDADRWWNSAAYDFARLVTHNLTANTVPDGSMAAWGAAWAAIAAALTLGLWFRHALTVHLALAVFTASQAVLALSVAWLLADGSVTALTAVGHFTDSAVVSALIIAAPLLHDRDGRLWWPRHRPRSAIDDAELEALGLRRHLLARLRQ